ncbi:transposase [Streptomyces sp. NPDC050803]|uniref:transposase n=1 Tax=unclassified Streptomyces TaxID=2593676 RepID=UPI003425222B
MLDAVFYVVDNSVKWRALPVDFPAWDRVYTFFRRWWAGGLIGELHGRLRGKVREAAGRDPKPSAAVIDSQVGQGRRGRGRRQPGLRRRQDVNGRRRHLICDTIGLLLAIRVTAADVTDRQAAVHDGAFSAMDLTARHPRTGELLPTVRFMVQTLAAAGELQRDLQRELTYDGLRAAEAKGSKGGRRPAVAADKTGDVRTAYLEGRSIVALARDHGVSRGAIRTAVADLMPDHAAIEEAAPPRSCRLPSTCRAMSPTSSAPPSWSPPSGRRSTKG